MAQTKKHGETPPATACACGDHVWRPANQGFVHMVSPEDGDLLAQRWTVCNVVTKGARPSPKFYVLRKVVRDGVRTTAYLHREIGSRMVGPEAPQQDHRDGNGLDNRRSNLRPATQSRNNYNRISWGKASRFKGLCRARWGKHKWVASIYAAGRGHNLGTYDTEEEAALAYNMAAIAVAGPFACVNDLNETELRIARTAITYIQRRVSAMLDRIAGAASSTPSGEDTGSYRTATPQTRRTIAASM